MEEKIATGRRKTAVSSIRLRRGSGKIDVNGMKFEDYFPLKIQQEAVLAPYELLENKEDYDMIIRVKGGGKQGQVDATRLALARALAKDNEKVHVLFKDKGFLTRDPRKRERKKYGRAGARKRFQFSKR